MEPREVLLASLIRLTAAGRSVGRHCDRAEHVEPIDYEELVKVASLLRLEAVRLADLTGLPILSLYSSRLEEIEVRSPYFPAPGFDGGTRALESKTMRQLQLVQIEHDRIFHPDVFGMSRYEQLRHYAFHLLKLLGMIAAACDDHEAWEPMQTRAIPDLFLFGIKLATLCGLRLDESQPGEESDPHLQTG